MNRRFSDWGGNIAALVLVLIVNVWSNLAPINDQSMTEISAKYPSLFTPAGFTFSIWGLIYVALIGFVVYQALPAQRSDSTIAHISPWFQVNCLANAGWLIAWHYDMLIVSLCLMVVLLVTLTGIYRTLRKEAHTFASQYLLLFVPFSLYTAWITLATIANLSVLQTAYGWDYFGMTAVNWTFLKLALAGTIGVTVVLRSRDVIFALVLAWGCYGIAVKQVSYPAVSGAATTVSLLALMLAGVTAINWLRR